MSIKVLKNVKRIGSREPLLEARDDVVSGGIRADRGERAGVS